MLVRLGGIKMYPNMSDGTKSFSCSFRNECVIHFGFFFHFTFLMLVFLFRFSSFINWKLMVNDFIRHKQSLWFYYVHFGLYAKQNTHKNTNSIYTYSLFHHHAVPSISLFSIVPLNGYFFRFFSFFACNILAHGVGMCLATFQL